MDEVFKSFHQLLSVVGINIFSRENNLYSKPWMVQQVINVIVSIFCFILTSGYIIVNSSDFLKWVEGAIIWTTGTIMTLSLGIFLIFQNDFRNFLKEMAFKDSMLDMPFVDYIFRHNLQTPIMVKLREIIIDTQHKLFKYIHIMLRAYFYISFIIVALYLSYPVYQTFKREDESQRIIAFEMWFPWSLENMIVYTFSYIYNVYSAFLCCIAYPGFQVIIVLLVGQVIRQLRILSFILENLNEIILEITETQDANWQAQCTNVLSQCVEHYIKIKSFSNRLNVICRPFYLVLILVATFLVCLCSVKIATSTKLSLDNMKIGSTVVQECTFVMIVLSFCLLGQQVENEAAVLERVVTEKWYIYNKNHKMNVLIFHMALSDRMPIYIFGTATLSLPTFTWFIKTGMSFFTLMMSVLEDVQDI